MSASWFHCSVKPISRAAGRSVVAAAAYRLGADLYDERYGKPQPYARRHGVEQAFTLAPSNAPAWVYDPDRLWNAAEKAETRKNSLVGRECEVALPSSLTPDDRTSLVRRLAQALVDRYGVAVSVGVHGPSAKGDDRNHHAHILMTTRAMAADGLGQKTRVLDDRTSGPKEVIWIRETAATLINAALEKAGREERVTHLSYEARGIDREATVHLGPSASEMERRDPGSSDRANLNREIEDSNRTLDGLVAELAAMDAEIAAAEEKRLDERYGALEPEAAPAPVAEAVPPPTTPQEAMARTFEASMRPALQPEQFQRDDFYRSLDPSRERQVTRETAVSPVTSASSRQVMAASFDAILRPAIQNVRESGESWIGARLWQATLDLYERGAEIVTSLGRDAVAGWRAFLHDESSGRPRERHPPDRDHELER